MKPSLSKMVDDDEVSIPISTSDMRDNEIVFKPKKTIAEKVRIIVKWFSSIFLNT